MSEMEDAWDAVHETLPAGWYVGRPSYHDERREWVMYAFDPSERPRVGSQPGVDRCGEDRGRRRARNGAVPARDRRRASAEVTMRDVGRAATNHRTLEGPPVFAWTDEPPRGAESREPGLRSLATRRNAVSFGGLAITTATLFWLHGDPHIEGVLVLIAPVILLVWAALAAVWVHVSSHRPAATLVAFGLGCALFVAAVLGWPFALRFSMARPELEAIAQRVLLTRTEEAPVRTQWLQADAAWPVDGAVYFQMGVFIDEWGLVYDPDRSTSWSRDGSFAPAWYQWMD